MDLLTKFLNKVMPRAEFRWYSPLPPDELAARLAAAAPANGSMYDLANFSLRRDYPLLEFRMRENRFHLTTRLKYTRSVGVLISGTIQVGSTGSSIDGSVELAEQTRIGLGIGMLIPLVMAIIAALKGLFTLDVHMIGAVLINSFIVLVIIGSAHGIFSLRHPEEADAIKRMMAAKESRPRPPAS
jgi:hypothetical protein